MFYFLHFNIPQTNKNRLFLTILLLGKLHFPILKSSALIHGDLVPFVLEINQVFFVMRGFSYRYSSYIPLFHIHCTSKYSTILAIQDNILLYILTIRKRQLTSYLKWSTVFLMYYSIFHSDNGIIYITPCKMQFCFVNTTFIAYSCILFPLF